MKLQLSLSSVALAMMAVVAVPAQAVLTGGGSGATCSLSDTTVHATKCSGSWAGNNKNQDADVYAELLGFTGIGGWSEVAGDLSGSAGTTGTFAINPTISGPFAIALKAANSFSLYFYDAGVTNLASLDFSTIGTSVNKQGMAQGLSHATLYTTSVSAVPEPAAWLLMLVGGLTLVARRSAGRTAYPNQQPMHAGSASAGAVT